MNKKNKIRSIIMTAGMALVFMSSGCVKTGSRRTGFELDNYERIGVARFLSYGGQASSGATVADEFIRQLMNEDKKIVEIKEPYVDSSQTSALVGHGYDMEGILTGTVTKYIPDSKETIYFKNKDGELVSEIYINEAEVGISAKFIDSKTGEVVWSNSYSYTSFDIQTAVSITVDMLVSDLKENDK